MAKNKTIERTQLERLRAHYDETFRHWTSEVKILQELSARRPRDAKALLEAGQRVDEAASAYRESRNTLTEFMIASQARDGQAQSAATQSSPSQTGAWPAGSDPAPERDAQVADLAHQLWEQAGRRNGKAESDCYQAEKMLPSRR